MRDTRWSGSRIWFSESDIPLVLIKSDASGEIGCGYHFGDDLRDHLVTIWAPFADCLGTVWGPFGEEFAECRGGTISYITTLILFRLFTLFTL